MRGNDEFGTSLPSVSAKTGAIIRAAVSILWTIAWTDATNIIMLLSQAIDSRCVLVPTVAAERFAIIRELVESLAAAGSIPEADSVARAVLAREEMRSTGIGYGLAVPHAKCDGPARLCVAIGRPPAPVDFRSVDGRPCELVILLVSPPNETAAHVQTLARISRMWLKDDFRLSIRQAPDAQSMLDVFRSGENTTG
ncbi:MAG: PTS sugar transporter subunit IIA [Phycisphaerales bacterium]|nr:PTS sugar transporter subunit IIA [Phycisphaerales bacterium]